VCYSAFLFGLFSVSVARALVPGDNPCYQRLATQLPFYQAAIQHPWPRLNLTETLSLGSQDPAVLILRQRLCRTHDLSEKACQKDAQTNYFDEVVAEGVAFFSRTTRTCCRRPSG
jgi:murein L,D-transpeptidase YcbB/YkuD